MKGRTILLVIALTLAVLPAAVAASAAEPAPEKENQAAEIAKNLGPEAAASLPPIAVNTDYRIGVNDILDIHVWKEPDLSRVIPVRPDGKISLPLAGDLRAEGKTPLELRAAIGERLKTFVSHPEVTVMVREINSQRYFIIGEVASPGTYPLTVPVTVMQALAMAGGFREFANTGNITIIRRGEKNSTVRINFSYRDWLKKKKAIEHLQLKNGDVIVVP